ncbi:MAG TPA: glycosyltransferase family 87 protein, partial [Bryobacteraceae bacterium]|nr:glycosyltransferase family 87 protein [Bryobacteraceae bacterium]
MMLLTPAAKVHASGVVMCVALTICASNFHDRGGASFLASLVFAGVAYLVAIRELFSTPAFPRKTLVVGLVFAAVWHVPFLLAPTGVDDDIHRYVWDGRLQRFGLSPYEIVPSDPAVRGLHISETRNLNNPDVPSPYPAGAQLFFRAVTTVSESTSALKVAFVLCEAAIILLLLHALRCEKRGAHLVLVYAWNPLLAIEVAGSGHVDIVGALLLLVSFIALGRRWTPTAAVTFGLAVSIKLLPIVLLPMYWKRVRWRDAALGASIVGLLYLPFIKFGYVPTGSLGTYVQSFRFNAPVFAELERVVAPQYIAGMAILVGLVTATWLRRASSGWYPDGFSWPMAASLLCAPVVYPWYLIWLLPFVRSASTLPI